MSEVLHLCRKPLVVWGCPWGKDSCRRPPTTAPPTRDDFTLSRFGTSSLGREEDRVGGFGVRDSGNGRDRDLSTPGKTPGSTQAPTRAHVQPRTPQGQTLTLLTRNLSGSGTGLDRSPLPGHRNVSPTGVLPRLCPPFLSGRPPDRPSSHHPPPPRSPQSLETPGFLHPRPHTVLFPGGCRTPGGASEGSQGRGFGNDKMGKDRGTNL